MNPDLLSAIATSIGAVAAVIAAGVAVMTLRSIRDDSVDRSRPVVIAELVIPPLGDHQMNLEVTNQGGSAARDLQVTFDPDPFIIPNDPRPDELATYLTRRYANTIPLLAVGSKLSNVYGMRTADNKISEPLPTRFRVTVRYSSLDRRHTYSDTFDLDVEVLGTATFGRPGGDDYDKRTTKAVEAIARGVGEI